MACRWKFGHASEPGHNTFVVYKHFITILELFIKISLHSKIAVPFLSITDIKAKPGKCGIIKSVKNKGRVWHKFF